ncbi:MAG: hypothetical protein HY314_12010 [Acidobacteria bacterium]|nr:hypothetical protein [Acidobacteriota bacterium]
MTVRLIKKREQAEAKTPEADKFDEKDLQRLARQLAKAWKVEPNSRLRGK